MKVNFGQFLRRRALLSPTVEATVEPSANGRRLNFSELNARSNRVAHALTASGVKPGDRVALLMTNCVESWRPLRGEFKDTVRAREQLVAELSIPGRLARRRGVNHCPATRPGGSA